MFMCAQSVAVHLPASVLRQGHGVPLVQVEVSGQLPQVRLGLRRLVDLEEQVDGVLPVSICSGKYRRGKSKRDSRKSVITVLFSNNGEYLNFVFVIAVL